MIGKEELDNEVESALKVTDKRKFNVDGSLREGIKLEKQKPETKKAVEPVVAQKLKVKHLQMLQLIWISLKQKIKQLKQKTSRQKRR